MANKTPDYILRAKSNYYNKFEHVDVKLPIGTKEKIKKLSDKSYSAFCSECILKELEKLENK